MKLTAALLVLMVWGKGVCGQQPTFAWAKEIGGTWQDIGRGIVVDAAGNSYTIGLFGNTIDFDPGPSVFNMSSHQVGDYDVFILKLDAAGNFLWAKQLSGQSSDWGLGITLDSLGNIYTTGFYSDSADFDPGPSVYNLNGGGAFIWKLDNNGNFLWAKRFAYCQGYSIKVDASGNVYTAGTFGGTIDFDPGAGVYNLTASSTEGVFLSKLNASGDFVWARLMGGFFGNCLSVDANKNVYLTGVFGGYTDFDPGPSAYRISSNGGDDLYVTKLDSSGNFKWAKGFGSYLSDQSFSVTNDAAGSVIFTGDFQDNVDFDPGPGTYTLSTGINPTGIFVAKLDASGNFVWAKRIIGYTPNNGGASQGNSVVTDAQDNVYVTGQLCMDADFNPGPDTFMVSSSGNNTFMLKLDNAGNFRWAYKFGDNSAGYSAAVDNYGNVYSTGFFKSGCFDPFSNSNCITTAGYEDFFVFKGGQFTLPLHLLTFTARLQSAAGSRQPTVKLNWTSENETNFDRYEVERSGDGRTFSKIGRVSSQLSIVSNHSYNFTDNSPLTTHNYYRLRMVDKDGTFSYSKIEKVSLSIVNYQLSIVPNPATSFVQLQFEKPLVGKVNIEVSDVSGKVVMRKVVSGNEVITLSTVKLAAGSYVVKVISGGEEYVQKMIVNK